MRSTKTSRRLDSISRAFRQSPTRHHENTRATEPAVCGSEIQTRCFVKYNLDRLSEGLTVERALELFLSACNKRDTLFITDQWIGPRLERLRQLLNNPLTAEEAEAMRDAVVKNGRLDDLIEWLSDKQLSWTTFNNGKKWLRDNEITLKREKRERELEQLEK